MGLWGVRGVRWLLTSKGLKKEPKGQLPGQWSVQKHRAREPERGERAKKPVTSEASAEKSWGWGLGTIMGLGLFMRRVPSVFPSHLRPWGLPAWEPAGPGLSKTLYLPMILKINVCLPKPWDQAWNQGCDLVQDCSLIVSQPFKELLRWGASLTSWASCMPSSLTLYLPLPLTRSHTCFCCFYLTFW